MFSCFCSNKKYQKENILHHSIDRLVKIENKIKIVNPISNECVIEKSFPGTIITTTYTLSYGIRYTVVCTLKKIFILDDNYNEIHQIELEDEITCSSSESYKPIFYIGCKSGRIIVYSIRKLEEKYIFHEVWNFYCFKPVYNITIQIDKIKGEIKRNIFVGYSRWGNDALQQLNI